MIVLVDAIRSVVVPAVHAGACHVGLVGVAHGVLVEGKPAELLLKLGELFGDEGEVGSQRAVHHDHDHVLARAA